MAAANLVDCPLKQGFALKPLCQSLHQHDSLLCPPRSLDIPHEIVKGLYHSLLCNLRVVLTKELCHFLAGLQLMDNLTGNAQPEAESSS